MRHFPEALPACRSQPDKPKSNRNKASSMARFFGRAVLLIANLSPVLNTPSVLAKSPQAREETQVQKNPVEAEWQTSEVPTYKSRLAIEETVKRGLPEVLDEVKPESFVEIQIRTDRGSIFLARGTDDLKRFLGSTMSPGVDGEVRRLIQTSDGITVGMNLITGIAKYIGFQDRGKVEDKKHLIVSTSVMVASGEIESRQTKPLPDEFVRKIKHYQKQYPGHTIELSLIKNLEKPKKQTDLYDEDDDSREIDAILVNILEALEQTFGRAYSGLPHNGNAYERSPTSTLTYFPSDVDIANLGEVKIFYTSTELPSGVYFEIHLIRDARDDSAGSYEEVAPFMAEEIRRATRIGLDPRNKTFGTPGQIAIQVTDSIPDTKYNDLFPTSEQALQHLFTPMAPQIMAEEMERAKQNGTIPDGNTIPKPTIFFTLQDPTSGTRPAMKIQVIKPERLQKCTWKESEPPETLPFESFTSEGGRYQIIWEKIAQENATSAKPAGFYITVRDNNFDQDRDKKKFFDINSENGEAYAREVFKQYIKIYK